MSRNTSSAKSGGTFKRLLGWTLLVAIVFSAGLITGERLVRHDSRTPIVSVADQVSDSSSKPPDDGEAGKQKTDPKEPTLAFFDKLTQKSQVDLSSKTTSSNHDAAPAAAAVSDHAANSASPSPRDSKSSESPARYTLQVAAHPSLGRAKDHMRRLRHIGLHPHVVSASIPGKDDFFRVRVGKFSTMEQAKSFQHDLKQKHSLSTFISPL